LLAAQAASPMILASFKVPSFAAEIAQFVWSAAVIVGGSCVVRKARNQQLSSRRAYSLVIVTLIGAFIGALLLGLVVYNHEDYGWNLLGRGKSFCGGLMGGAMAATLFLWSRHVSVTRYGDIMVT